MRGNVFTRIERVGLALILATNVAAASLFFVHQRGDIAAAAALLKETGANRRAPVLATAVELAVSSSDAAKFAAFACIRDLLLVEHDSGSLENALLGMSLPAYPMPYPSARGDYASVFLSNQEFLETARTGRIAGIAPEVLGREIAGSRALLLAALRSDAGSVVLRNLAGLLPPQNRVRESSRP